MIAGSFSPFEPGCPELPAITYNYLLPQNTRLKKIEILVEEWQEIPGNFYIYPKQKEMIIFDWFIFDRRLKSFDKTPLEHFIDINKDAPPEEKRIYENLVKKQDIILAFEQKRHINKLKRRFKNLDLDEKVFLLLEYTGETENLDIEDPFYLEQEEYNVILKRIEDGVLKIIKKIININSSEKG